MKRTSLASAIAAVAMIAFGLWAWHRKELPLTLQPPIGDTQSVRVPSAGSKELPDSAKMPKRSEKPSSGQSIEDLKAQSVELLQKAQAGDAQAQFSLASIYSDCQSYSVNPAGYVGYGRDPNPTPPRFDRAAYVQVFDQHVARCSGFAPGEIKIAAINEWYSKAAQAGSVEALAHELSRQGMSSDPETVKRNVDAVIASGNPRAIDELADAMGLKAEGNESIFGQNSGTERDWYAWKLAACDLGLPCGPESAAANSYCLTMYACGLGGVESIYQNHMLSAEDFEAVQKKTKGNLPPLQKRIGTGTLCPRTEAVRDALRFPSGSARIGRAEQHAWKNPESWRETRRCLSSGRTRAVS